METAKPLMKQFRKPSPPPSPEGFEWPKRNDKKARGRFMAALSELMDEKGLSASAICTGIYGAKKNKQGHTLPRNLTNFNAWKNGQKYPRQVGAEYLAQFLDVPLVRLVTPRGKGKPATNGNGSAGHAVVAKVEQAATVATPGVEVTKAKPQKVMKRVPGAPAYQLLPLPEGAEHAVLELKSFKGDSHFMNVQITGVVQAEIAQLLLAMMSTEAPAADEDEHS